LASSALSFIVCASALALGDVEAGGLIFSAADGGLGGVDEGGWVEGEGVWAIAAPAVINVANREMGINFFIAATP